MGHLLGMVYVKILLPVDISAVLSQIIVPRTAAFVKVFLKILLNYRD